MNVTQGPWYVLDLRNNPMIGQIRIVSASEGYTVALCGHSLANAKVLAAAWEMREALRMAESALLQHNGNARAIATVRAAMMSAGDEPAMAMPHVAEPMMSVKAHKRRLYETGLLVGNVSLWLGNGCDSGKAEEELDLICEKLFEDAK